VKGKNVIHLNQATIVAAVQEYLDRRLVANAEKQKVLAVNTALVNGTTSYDATIEEIVK
jgi:hypothetical protein